MSKLLEVKNLEKSYGSKKVVNNISFNVCEGEILGLLGPNGAGKSTTLNILSSLYKYNGSVKFLGRELQSGGKINKKYIGIVPQDIALFEELSAWENVEFFASLYGLKGEKLKERVNEALEFVGLLDKSKDLPSTFSGGMKRRLNIACSIAHKPKLLIMDEPTVGIDPQSRNHILQSVKKLNEEGVSIIYTSHYMEEIESVCDRIIIMDKGKIISEGDKNSLLKQIKNKKKYRLFLSNYINLDLSMFDKVNCIEMIQFNDEILDITSSNSEEILHIIIEILNTNRINIENVEIQQPSLEMLFLETTGIDLRD